MLTRGLLLVLGLLGMVCAVAVQAAPVFPVKYSADQRYLVDQAGVPFPIMGRTAWFVTSLPVADYHTFIDDTVARGYSAIELHVVNHDPRGNHPPFNGNGDAPFLKRLDGSNWNGVLAGSAPDFTTPNEAYWSVVDGFLAYCEAKGLLVFLFPAYVGYQGGDQGWMQEMLANGPAKMQTYGVFIATRYKNQKNLVWMMGGDMGTAPNTFNAAQTNVEAALLTGLQSVAGQQSTYFSAEWNSESIGTDQTTFGSAMTLNSVYSGQGDVSAQSRRGYAHGPVEPAYLLEEPYDEEGPDGNNVNGNATQPVRRFQWWGWLSTIGGYISGNGYVWPFNPGWTAHLDTQNTRDMTRLNAFMQSIAWYKLVPSGLGGMKTLITAGGGSTMFDYVAAAATLDGTLLVAYLSPFRSGPITVDMTAMSGLARARWFDPTNAVYTDISGGAYSLPNTGTHTFTPPGNNSRGEQDWVLLLETNAHSSNLNYQGLWWKSPGGSEDGWGINFAHQGETIFGTWFTYDTTGKGWWLTLIADDNATHGVYAGNVFATTGPPFYTVPFVKTGPLPPAAGTATLTFTDANNGSFHYDVNLPSGIVSQTKAITRQPLGAAPMATCVFGGPPPLAAATNYQDIWWAGSSANPGTEQGWGINFAQQGDVVFASWFIYDLDGTPLWLVATLTKLAPGIYKGDLLRPSGPRFDAYDKSQFHPNAAVGTLTLNISDGNNASITYTVQLAGMANSVTQTKIITRQLFSTFGTSCQ